MLASPEAVITRLLCADSARTKFVCPAKTSRQSPVSTSQSRAVLSHAPDTIRSPFGVQGQAPHAVFVAFELADQFAGFEIPQADVVSVRAVRVIASDRSIGSRVKRAE